MKHVCAALVAALAACAIPASAQQRQVAAATEMVLGSDASEIGRLLTPPDGGKPMIVYLWAADCPPCGDVRPAIEALKARWPHTLRIVGIGSKPYAPGLGATLKLHGLTPTVPLAVLVLKGGIATHHWGKLGLEAKLREWAAAHGR